MRTVVTNGALDGKNPYLRLLQSGLRRYDITLTSPADTAPGAADVVHLHWPEHAFLSRNRFRGWLRSRRRGGHLTGVRLDDCPVVWTVHNAAPHQAESLHFDRRGFAREVLAQVDVWIALSRAGIPAVLDAFPELTNVAHEVIPHHSYVELTGPRAHDETGGVIHFGQLRDNKGVPGLLAAWEAARPETELVIVGELRGATPIDDTPSSSRSVRLRAEYVPDAELADLVSGSCLAALPFSGGLNSGSVMFALSCATPVLVPATPTFRELRERVGPSWMRLFDTETPSPTTLGEAIAWAREPRPDPPDLGFAAVDRVASLHAALYDRLCRSSW